MVKNKSKFVFAAIGLIASLFLANIASAEIKTFIKEYTYMASDIDSKVSSRAIALEQVKRALLEQLGTYLISETEVKNFRMTKDQITTLTAGIVSAEVIDEKWDGRTYYLRAKITADPNEVAKSVDATKNDVQNRKELEDSKKQADEAMVELDRLKRELNLIKASSKNQNDYANAINNLTVTDWFNKGKSHYASKSYILAIDAFNKTIELNPKYFEAYGNRGNTYYALGNKQQAIRDYDKAIELNPKDARPYNNRGFSYYDLGNKQQAISDYSKAIELNPKYFEAYGNRGNAYYALGNKQQAIRDYDKAIELNPKDARPYNNRGFSYYALGNHQQAINDCNKAIELNPKYAEAYYCQGLANYALGNKQQSIQNYKMAAKLGHEQAQNYLNSIGIGWQ